MSQPTKVLGRYPLLFLEWVEELVRKAPSNERVITLIHEAFIKGERVPGDERHAGGGIPRGYSRKSLRPVVR